MNDAGAKAKPKGVRAPGFGFGANHDRLGIQRIEMGSGKA